MNNLHGGDLLSLADLNADELHDLLTLAAKLKYGDLRPRCDGKVLGLLFYKASTRTRVSFSVAMCQLGGQVIDLNPSTTQVGRGEPISDTARVLERYLDILAIRTFAQQDIATFADYADIPIINALTDVYHPCQILADLLTVRECFGKLNGLTLTFLGDGNNVAHSLLLGCALTGVNIRVATPPEFKPDDAIVARARQLATDSTIAIVDDAKAAVEGAHVLYTDVWASMGQEDSAVDRLPVFQPYQLNSGLVQLAAPEAIVLHCLPAHREEEITTEVIEGKQSRVWDQAENRMHAQKALIASLLGLVV
ncbi:ornithine carbamoyltransferase [Rubidibacter lacunae KORDI 51-2]|uniref:Ornithine carbamoyltransferase n=1 Tax=Rubidibacter lacunae KORDI 51-2 TaxID=582515 RepID=U5DM73_9CHRO|nr:ornithine carbamoyltransferase [Rubidibacter lacunae]ERN40815.1 ornithine carbamoyltransferase [Rubidibacter lacunae KORDI 51-2]